MVQVTINLDEEQLRALFKQALIELLQERHDSLYDLLVEVMEEVALVKAIQEGETTETVGRDEVWQVLEA